MKILLIGINYAPEMISTAVYTTGLADYFAQKGHNISVVCAQPYYPQWKIAMGWPRFWYKSLTSPLDVQITHCPLYVPKIPTGKKRILHHISFALTAMPIALWKAWRIRPDIVFVVAPSMLSGPVGLAAAKLGRAKSWLHIQDFEVEAAFATGLLTQNSFLGRLAHRFEKWVLGRFDRVSTISKPMMEKLYQKNVPIHRVYELRNWANLSKISPLTAPFVMKTELGIGPRFVVLYSGNLANKQGLEIIPEIAKNLTHRPDIMIVVCGDGPMKELLIQSSIGKENILFVPLQPLDRLNELLGMADIHFLPQIAEAADLVLPSKLTNMLASGRPTVATAWPKTALAQEIDTCGIIVPPNDATAAAAAIIALIDDPKKRAEMGRNARARALDVWDGNAILNRLEQEFYA